MPTDRTPLTTVARAFEILSLLWELDGAGPSEIASRLDLPDSTVLVQVNDRAPQHLYPKLDDRGYDYATVEADDAVVTGIWRPLD